MASKIKVDQIQTADGSGTIALQNQLSGMTTASLPALGSAQMPAGSILQIQKAGTFSTTTSTANSFGDTNMSVGITPSSTSSKIVIAWGGMIMITGGAAALRMGFKVIRKVSGGSDTAIVNTSESMELLQVRGTPSEVNGALSGVWLDEPSTTSAITYMYQIRKHPDTTQAILLSSSQGSQMIAYEIKG